MPKHTFTQRWRIPERNVWDHKTQAMTKIPPREVVVEIEIDTIGIAAKMAATAANNKSKRSREVSGAVIVTVVSDQPVE
jgi:hypothetical protein